MSELHLHHVHLFTEDIEITLQWWIDSLRAKVEFDGLMANSRNVFLRVGEGRLHLYDQRPNNYESNAIHHIGIRVKDLEKLYTYLHSIGVDLPNPIHRFGNWSYAMCMAPDNVLLELFQVDEKNMEGPLNSYFGDSSSFSGI